MLARSCAEHSGFSRDVEGGFHAAAQRVAARQGARGRRGQVSPAGRFRGDLYYRLNVVKLRMQKAGWRTAYLRVPLAAGLATERLMLHIGQRLRWARGMLAYDMAYGAAAKPFLDARRMGLLTAVADTIIPKTATPGAVERRIEWTMPTNSSPRP